MNVYEMYPCCGGKHSFYVGRANQDVSLVLDARGACQRCLSWSVCVLASKWFKTFIPINSYQVEPAKCVKVPSKFSEACVCSLCVCFACDSLPPGSLSRSCLAGGSSVSQGVSWLMGVCPHLTPGASSSPGVWLSPGERPETCRRAIKTKASN